MAPSTSGWIDIHGHFFLPSTEEQRVARWKACREADFLVPEPWDWKPEETIKYLDKAGIQMQMLSYIPRGLDMLKKGNEYGASVVKQYPDRFGLLAALPIDNVEACLHEIDRATSELHCDGFAVCCAPGDSGVYLGDKELDIVWEKLDAMGAAVFTHPDAYKPGHRGRPSPLIEVAFDTTRVVVDMLYQGTFQKFPNIKWIISHGGGGVPVLADRLELLGTEPWVPNHNELRKEDVKKYLSKLYLDTAAVGVASLLPALHLVGKGHVCYGADCGVPCSTDRTMDENKANILEYEGLSEEERSNIGRNLYSLFPRAVKRMGKSASNGHTNGHTTNGA